MIPARNSIETFRKSTPCIVINNTAFLVGICVFMRNFVTQTILFHNSFLPIFFLLGGEGAHAWESLFTAWQAVDCSTCRWIGV